METFVEKASLSKKLVTLKLLVVAGVNLDKKASLPPPPPVYGHSIEKFVDPSEEKKNFMQILQKAQISYQNHQVHPNSARTPSVDGISSFNQKPGI